MKWDIRKEAIKLAIKMGGTEELGDGEFETIKRIDTRTYKINMSSKYIQQTVSAFEKDYKEELSIELLIKGKEKIEPESSTIIEENDILLVSGLVAAFSKLATTLGQEIAEFGENINFIEEVRSIIITNNKFTDITLVEVKEKLSLSDKHGIFINAINRVARPLPFYVPVIPNWEVLIQELQISYKPLAWRFLLV